jgi:D-alanine-D-alanine ligase
VIARIESRFAYPVFAKPANLGSSVGIHKARDRAGLRTALDDAARYDRRLLLEQSAQNPREIEMSVLGNDDPIASVPGEVIPGDEFYSYADKYLRDEAQLIIPADVTPEQTAELQRIAIAAYRAIDCAGLARCDFFLERETGRIWMNELNTIPGFTSISMYPKLWEASGISYPELIDRLVELALERYEDRGRNVTTYEPE